MVSQVKIRFLLVCILFVALAACASAGVEDEPNPIRTAGSLTLTVEPTLIPAETPLPPPAEIASPTGPARPEDTRATAPVDPTQTAAPSSPPSETVTSFPEQTGYEWVVFARGLSAPIGLANAGDGSGRLFVLEKAGLIRTIQDGELLPDPFLNITDRVGSGGSEQGLLGLAFHPGFSENGFFYVNYTDRQGDTVIARYQVSPNGSTRADPVNETILLQVPQPFGNHNGGSVVFGPDGYLYLGLGDGGSGGDPQDNAQSLNTRLGKILRIDIDHGDPYSIPADNPFVEGGGEPEIWAYGLRNPWRFSFDRATGELYIADVGQNQWEEVNYLPASSPVGANFGWNYFEGSQPYAGSPPAGVELIFPVAEYGRNQGCSVTGGYVYRGSRLPAWQGIYVFGDYCSGNVWGLLRDAQGEWDQAVLFENVGRITSFGEDETGEIYLTDYAGAVYLLTER